MKNSVLLAKVLLLAVWSLTAQAQVPGDGTEAHGGDPTRAFIMDVWEQTAGHVATYSENFPEVSSAQLTQAALREPRPEIVEYDLNCDGIHGAPSCYDRLQDLVSVNRRLFDSMDASEKIRTAVHELFRRLNLDDDYMLSSRLISFTGSEHFMNRYFTETRTRYCPENRSVCEFTSTLDSRVIRADFDGTMPIGIHLFAGQQMTVQLLSGEFDCRYDRNGSWYRCPNGNSQLTSFWLEGHGSWSDMTALGPNRRRFTLSATNSGPVLAGVMTRVWWEAYSRDSSGRHWTHPQSDTHFSGTIRLRVRILNLPVVH